MKTLLHSFLLCLIGATAGLAQTRVAKGDTTAPLNPNRIAIGATSAGRVGAKASTGNFNAFAYTSEILTTSALDTRYRLQGTLINYNTDLSNKPVIPTVPTVVSAFTNDAGYATTTNVNTALATKADATPLGYVEVNSYAAMQAYTVPAGRAYLIKVASDESQTTPYNVDQVYWKLSSGKYSKFALDALN